MKMLDTMIASAALQHLTGGLSAAGADNERITASHLAANYVVLPICGWLSVHIGRRNLFLLSIGALKLASAIATRRGGAECDLGKIAPGLHPREAENRRLDKTLSAFSMDSGIKLVATPTRGHDVAQTLDRAVLPPVRPMLPSAGVCERLLQQWLDDIGP